MFHLRSNSFWAALPRLWFLLLISGLSLTGCGNSASDASPGDGGTPFGLDQRPPLAELNLPVTPPGSDLVLEDAFPALPAFTSPVYLTHSGDGRNRLFVVEQAGIIKVFANDPAVTRASIFLDIRANVVDGGEMGLLGLAFDPDYASSGQFYLYYTDHSCPGGARCSVLARYQVSSTDPDRADADSETVLLRVEQPYENHNGGTLAFGPDGMLYWGLGDGGGGGDPDDNSQNTRSLLGKLLRLDVRHQTTYSIPADNPFTGNSAYAPEIWALGLRNPYRFAFDRDNGRLWLADVGQDAVEEINLIERGGNYGWPWYEGSTALRDNPPDTSLFRFPVHEYDHSLGASITGGQVYRGSRIPALQGHYLYADFVSANVWILGVDADLNPLDNRLLTTAPQNVSAIGEDEDGELYLVGYGGTLYAVRSLDSSDPLAGFPARLSTTGLFTDLADLVPASGLIEYGVRAPLWTDHAGKQRWIGIPDTSRIGFSSDGNWQFPVGTVLVKHFDMEMTAGDPVSRRRLETRILLRQTGRWVGATYRWNPEQTDATLLSDATTETLTIADPAAPGGERVQDYYYPGPADCLACHTAIAGRVLGVRTRQLNGDFTYPGTTDNQLRAWNHIGLFSTDIGNTRTYPAHAIPTDSSASLDARARSYLDANCAFCHTAGGTTPSRLDLSSTVTRDAMNAIDVSPSAGDLGLADARLIAPGDRRRSVLWERLTRTDDNRMPRLGTSVPDTAGIDLIGDWIDSLP